MDKSISRNFFFTCFLNIFKDNLMKKFLKINPVEISRVFFYLEMYFLKFWTNLNAWNSLAQSSSTKCVMIFAKLVLILTNQNAQITNFAFGKLVSTKRLSRWFGPKYIRRSPNDILTFIICIRPIFLHSLPYMKTMAKISHHQYQSLQLSDHCYFRYSCNMFV